MSTRQADNILSQLEGIRLVFDFTQDKLGDDICRIATNGCYFAFRNGFDPDGNEIPALSKAYAEWKARQFPGRPLGILEFEMAKKEHFDGFVQATANECSVTYGLNEQAKEEFAWFNEGDAERNRPPRPIWGLTEEAKIEITKLLNERLRRALR